MSVYDVPLKSLDGEPGVLAEQKGKVALLVNVASFCGLTPQYEGLEALYERFGAKGFSVVGIPCNQFGAQEPGTADEIKTFCSRNYHVTFPMYSKISVAGGDKAPLYKFLTSANGGEVKWNFTNKRRAVLRAPGGSAPGSGERNIRSTGR